MTADFQTRPHLHARCPFSLNLRVRAPACEQLGHTDAPTLDTELGGSEAGLDLTPVAVGTIRMAPVVVPAEHRTSTKHRLWARAAGSPSHPRPGRPGHGPPGHTPHSFAVRTTCRDISTA